MSTPLLRLQHVAKVFGTFVALRDATADFDAGKLYLITGENGAGKSTLLRIVAGLSSPSRGAVERAFAAGELGYMAHASMLYDELSGIENLEYFGKLYGSSAAQSRTAMEMVDLDPGLSRPVAQYSQGMRQRLALARAVQNDPKILLLDEPFSNLDVRSTAHMMQVLSAKRDAGTCILVVTHQAALVEPAADEHLHIESGVMRSMVAEVAR